MTFQFIQNRIIYLELHHWSSKIIESNRPTTSGLTKNERILIRTFFKCHLNTDRHRTSTTSLGSLFQCLTTITVKTHFLMSHPNLPWCYFVPFPCVLSPVTREKSSVPPPPLPLLKKLKRDVVQKFSIPIQRHFQFCHGTTAPTLTSGFCEGPSRAWIHPNRPSLAFRCEVIAKAVSKRQENHMHDCPWVQCDQLKLISPYAVSHDARSLPPCSCGHAARVSHTSSLTDPTKRMAVGHTSFNVKMALEKNRNTPSACRCIIKHTNQWLQQHREARKKPISTNKASKNHRLTTRRNIKKPKKFPQSTATLNSSVFEERRSYLAMYHTTKSRVVFKKVQNHRVMTNPVLYN